MMKNSPIVLLTDFGLTDHYVGVMKGVILSIHPKAVIVDLAHGIPPQNIFQGALLLEDNYHFFPKGSIFVCVVDPGVGSHRKAIAVQSKDYYFLGPDNGVLSLALAHEKKLTVHSLENKKFRSSHPTSSTFHGRDVFSPAAAHLSRNRDTVFKQLGSKVMTYTKIEMPPVRKRPNEMEGKVLFFDHFGNGITNVKKSDAEDFFWGKAEIYVDGKKAGKIQRTYAECPGSLAVVFNSNSRLEICLRNDSAQKKYQLQNGSHVLIKAKD